ncbi:MAG: DNA-formamidopyrimidine glycosylase [Candidatus Moranbacteria bacterium]|jgi:formamidopyrimidine-DNA glycosylase|nr:DNA-formamidopyrimidine glycosylase [Candidatus Moranbacteria bacterium]
MPELPEVQTVVTQIGKKITGKTLVDFWTDWDKKVLEPVSKVKKLIKGAAVLGTRRFGKTIVIDLDNRYSIVIHLKMTGHLLYKDKDNEEAKEWRDPTNQFIHHRFQFTDGSRVDFSDMRKFGWVDMCQTEALVKHRHIEKLGIDALSREFTSDMFRTFLDRSPKKPIGILLLEQEKIAGIGNIYRSEALYRAGILPWRLSGALKPKEAMFLHAHIQQVLQEAVRLRGTTDGDFRDTDGKRGSFQKRLYVYGRTGQPCKKCGTIIERKKIGSRSIFFCSACQR